MATSETDATMNPVAEQQQSSAHDQLQGAAATAPPQIQQQQSPNLPNNANGTGNDPFQCLWSGCRERTQSAEALYVCDTKLNDSLYLLMLFRTTFAKSTSVGKAPITST